MTYDRERHHRRSIRLKGYDYSQPGAYFITICTQDRACLFGEVVGGEMRLNEAGRIVADAWQWLDVRYDYVELDEWVVMPNHLHGIIVIVDDICRGGSRTDGRGGSRTDGRGGSRTAPTGDTHDIATKRKAIGRLVGAFKTVSTKQINESLQAPSRPVWQRNYYEHIIRDGESLHRIREYIANNPLHWALDRENPKLAGSGTRPAPGIEDESWRI
jgi:REP element-mobilizing transposase RayT